MILKALICNCFQDTTVFKQKVWQLLDLHDLYAYTQVKSATVVKKPLVSEKILLKAEEKTNNNVRRINQHILTIV